MITEHGNKRDFWRSPAGVALGVFAAVVGGLLALEHRAHLVGALPLLLVLGVCVGMHFFMHGGHGSHGGDGRGKEDGDAR